jgi:replicative DNA helicase
MLYDVSSARMLIGLVLNNPTILYNGRYKLNRSDFSPNLFHKTLFAIIERLAETGMEQIDEKAVCTFIESTEDYAVQREVLEDNEYLGFIKSIKEVVKTSDETIDYYYNNVRKFSLLRDYKNNGIDITSVYDELGDEDEQRRKLNDLTIGEIIDTFDNMLGKIRKEYSVNSSVEEVKAGDGFDAVKEQFKETPFYGMSYQSEYLNAITRGQIKGQISCFTSGSAVGKTTIGIGDVCKVASKQLYDSTKHCYIDNPCCVSTGALIIQFELDVQFEVMPKIVSYISDVPSPKILDGKYTNDEEQRVDKAIEILKKSNIYVVYMPDFTTKSIADCVKEYKVQHNIDYVFFDYIADNSAVNNELQSNSKVKIRTDQVLESLTDALKNIARENDIHIRTATQANVKLKENEILDESVIAGSRAVTNKLDIGGVLAFPRKKELEEVEPLLPDNMPCTHCLHLYKVRFGRYQKNVKVWLNVDLGTGRVTDLLTTAWDNTLLEGDDKVPKMKLEKINEKI